MQVYGNYNGSVSRAPGILLSLGVGCSTSGAIISAGVVPRICLLARINMRIPGTGNGQELLSAGSVIEGDTCKGGGGFRI